MQAMRIPTGLVLWFLGCVFLFGVAHGATRYYDFVLKDTDFTRLCETKSMLTVNGSFPGPEIHAHKGDTVFVTVYNQGTYGITIHWHGVKQPRNPWSDGPENVTQCPIEAGGNFTQEIALSDEEGTLWWHAHSDWSRATIHGALIVYPAHGTTYPFKKPDEEKTIVLASWYKSDVMAVITEAIKNGGEPNTSDAFTINGQPGDLYNCSKDSTYNLVVEHGKTYLLRIINAVLNEEMFFGIANHTMTLVGQDGAYLKPISEPWIMITPGQTIDVLFKASKPRGYYYMAASAFADATGVPFDETTTTGIVRYVGRVGKPVTRPRAIPLPTLPVSNDSATAFSFVKKVKGLTTNGLPLDVPKNITKKIIMAISFNAIPCPENSTIDCLGYMGNIQSASLNNVSFWTPKVDILQAWYKNLSGIYTPDFPSVPPEFYNFTGNLSDLNVFTKTGTKTININYGEGVEFVFQGTNIASVAENHPMHLHGYSFYLVGKGNGNFDSKRDPPKYNLFNPPLVNTIGVPRNGWATIRFVANNPGVWFMHCHLERHASWGMATVVIVGNGPTNATSVRRPPAYMPPCSP